MTAVDPPRAAGGPAHPRTQLLKLVRRGTGFEADRFAPRVRGARPAAVLLLFGVLDAHPAHRRSAAVPGDLDVLLVGRARSLSDHPGQVSFPGGRIDPGDAGPEAAAVREAVEETGLDPAGVEVLGTLGRRAVPVSNHVVTPVLAWWAAPSPVAVVDHGESALVFRTPVADLLDPARRRTAVMATTRGEHRSPAFLLDGPDGTPRDGPVVWGFTALVLDAVFDGLGWTQPWDEDVTLPAPR